MKRRTKFITTFLLLAEAAQGWAAVFSRISSDPVKVFPGSDATFQWNLDKNLTSMPDFQALVFGLWRDGFVATYITTVTRNGRVIPNPDLNKEAPRFDGRVQWKGDLSKSLAAFQLSDVSIEDQTDYGLLLNFGAFRHSPTDSVRLEVEDMSSMITALPSLPIRARKGKNLTFHCEFRVAPEDEAQYEGIAVGVWERGEIALTLMTATKEYIIFMNPNLYEEGPEYSQRVRAHLSTNRTSNTSKVSVELAEVKESDERYYGCSMYFGPFREPLGSSVSVDVEGTNTNSNGLSFVTSDNNNTWVVRVDKDVVLPCPVLSEVIKLDRTFQSLYWSYCTSKTCTTIETKWSWIAGMNNSRATKVIDKGLYNGRVNLTRNGNLMLYNVGISDGTVYMCTVQRVNFTSAERYFATLIINATGWAAVFSRISLDPVKVSPGSDATFQWNLGKNLTSMPDFQALVFGLWRDGFVATYITTVTRNGRVIPNPDLNKEAPRFDGRVQWKGDLSESLAAFQLSYVSIEDQTDYGLLLNFGAFRHSPTDSVRLEVEESPSITKRSKAKVTVLEGNPLVLFCEAKGYPLPHITWSKNGKLLPSSDNGRKFIIHETSKKDAGDYRCEASNSVGTARYSCSVEITSKGDSGKKWTPLTITLLSVSVVLVLCLVGCCAWRRQTSASRRSYNTEPFEEAVVALSPCKVDVFT